LTAGLQMEDANKPAAIELAVDLLPSDTNIKGIRSLHFALGQLGPGGSGLLYFSSFQLHCAFIALISIVRRRRRSQKDWVVFCSFASAFEDHTSKWSDIVDRVASSHLCYSSLPLLLTCHYEIGKLEVIELQTSFKRRDPLLRINFVIELLPVYIIVRIRGCTCMILSHCECD